MMPNNNAEMYPYAKLNDTEKQILSRLEQDIRRETGRELLLVVHQKGRA